MIEYKTGNILDSKCQALVVPVNIIGVAGAGLAKQFKEKHPYWYMNYHTWCYNKIAGLGKVHVYMHWLNEYIISFPTKKHWRNPSRIEYIEVGLEALVELLDEGVGVFKDSIESIAIPKLGCGLGGLDWIQVRNLIEKYLNNHAVHVEVYI